MTTYTTEIDIGDASEQRVYGVLGGDCYFNLHRIALVYGSESESPTYSSTTYYGDSPTYVQTTNCGLNYSGYLSIMFSLDNDFDNPIAVAEIHKCAKGKSYLFVESYGIKKPSTSISLWFNQKKSGENWIFLNSTPTNVVMPYKSDTFKFSEKKTADVIEITGCRKCNNGKCLVCDLGSKFKVEDNSFGITGCKTITFNYSLPDCVENWDFVAPDTTVTLSAAAPTATTIYGSSLKVKNYGVEKYGDYTYAFPNINVEYTLNCDTIDTYVYDTNQGVCRAYYLNDFATWNTIYDTLSLVTDYTWNLNNDGFPTHAIELHRKTVTYEYESQPFFNSYTGLFISTNYNIYVKTNDIFDKSPKYLEKSTSNCIQLVDGSSKYVWGTSTKCGFSDGLNGYCSSKCGNNAGIFTFSISTTYDKNSIWTKTNNKSYYIKYGWKSFGINSGWGQLTYDSNNIYGFHQISSGGVEIGVLSIINKSTLNITSYISNVGGDYNSCFCIFDNKIIITSGRYIASNTRAIFTDIYTTQLNLDPKNYISSMINFRNFHNTESDLILYSGVSGDYAIVLENNCVYIWKNSSWFNTGQVQHPIYIENFNSLHNGVIHNNKLYMVSDSLYYGGTWGYLNNLSEYGSNIYSISKPSGCTLEPSSGCSHNGYLYYEGYKNSIPYLFKFDEGIITDMFSIPAFGSLVSYGNYLVLITQEAPSQGLPSILIFDDEDLGL
jgi:hypothetical protein